MASLVPDTAGIQAAVSALDASTASVITAAQNLVNTDLTSFVWQMIGGANPTILSAVQAEQVNAKAFLQLDIMTGVKASIADFAAIFAAQSAIMLTTLTAAGTNPLTPAQQKTLGAAMAVLMTGLAAQQKIIADKAAATKVLSDQINDPTGNLMVGEAAVQGVIDSTTKNMNDLEAAADWPGADPDIGMGIVADQTEINWLQGLLSVLQGLVTANSQMGQALAGTLVVWQTLTVKYQSIAADIGQAGADPAFVGVGDVKAAQLAWAQLATYAHGLT